MSQDFCKIQYFHKIRSKREIFSPTFTREMGPFLHVKVGKNFAFRAYFMKTVTNCTTRGENELFQPRVRCSARVVVEGAEGMKVM